MRRLIIAPLSMPGSLTEDCKTRVLHAKTLFLQTALHPSASWIVDAGISFCSMDDLYESAEDFDALNAKIAERLFCADGEESVYAVPGRGPGQAQLEAIQGVAAACGASVQLLPAAGYAEAALAAAGISASSRTICAANALPGHIDTDSLLCVEELDTRMRAGEVKLALLEYYPDEHIVSLATSGDAGAYRVEQFPLDELDRRCGFFASSVLLVPPAPFLSLERHGGDSLLWLVKRLRAPGGCPWDAKQTHASLKTALIEEAYEVIDAIAAGDDDALCEELGDLALQVYFHAVLGQERGAFTLRDVYTGIVNKLIYRHPHVFGTVHVADANEVLINWEALKRKEKHMDTRADAMRAVPKVFPALMRSRKIQAKAADVGFDWREASEALAKVYEEADELGAAIRDKKGIAEEMGDLLFSAVNVARLLKLDPELTLQEANDKFMERFSIMEDIARERGLDLSKMTLEEMDRFWNMAKSKKNGDEQ